MVVTLLNMKAPSLGPSQIIYVALNTINGVVCAKHCVATTRAPHDTFHTDQFTTRIVVLRTHFQMRQILIVSKGHHKMVTTFPLELFELL